MLVYWLDILAQPFLLSSASLLAGKLRMDPLCAGAWRGDRRRRWNDPRYGAG